MSESTLGARVLAVPMSSDNDSGATPVRGYLIEFARQVWIHGEGFSGKRPFGNSGWEWEVYAALGAAGLVPVSRNRWDEDEADQDEAERLVLLALDELAAGG